MPSSKRQRTEKKRRGRDVLWPIDRNDQLFKFLDDAMKGQVTPADVDWASRFDPNQLKSVRLFYAQECLERSANLTTSIALFRNDKSIPTAEELSIYTAGWFANRMYEYMGRKEAQAELQAMLDVI